MLYDCKKNELLLSTEDSKPFVYPFLSKEEKNPYSVSIYVTKFLRKAIGKVKGIFKNTSAHDARSGAADDMSSNPNLDIFALIYRGGWSYKGDCTVFQYVERRRNMIRAGKALSGLSDVRMEIVPPSVEYVYDEIDKKERNELVFIMNNLFEALPNADNEHEPLHSFKPILMGSLMANLTSIIELFHESGHDNVLLQIVRAQVVLTDLSFDRFVEIGTMVRAKCAYMLY